jgi:uncharacterized protein
MLDWPKITTDLNNNGYSRISNLLTADECRHLQSFYNEPEFYRSTIDMQRYRFGKGEYKYFSYPLPPKIESLRETMYEPLALIANDWMRELKIQLVYPQDHKSFISQCHAKGQTRPTPLILKYETGGFNTLHQDLYGEIYFPFQVVIVLTHPGKDHEGGELVFVEQLPRAQSKAEVVSPNQGDAIIFTTNFRPIKGSKGFYRAKMKHGVSPLRSGRRFAMGIIFHDAS